MAQFNPVQSFQTANQNRLSQITQQQGIDRESLQAPIRDQLSQLNLKQAQTGVERGDQQFDQNQALQRAKIINQSARALKQIPLESRGKALLSLEPQLEQFGIPVGSFSPDQLTDENLDEAIASTQGFLQNPNTLSAAMRDFQSKTQGLTSGDQEKARRISLGLDPRAVGSSSQTITNLGTGQDVAATESLIAEGKETGKLDAQGRLLPDLEKQKVFAKDAAALSTQLFKEINTVEKNIVNLKEGIRLIDSGAAAGPIDKWFPSYRPQTIALDNLKNRLGLDVISSITFGALSERELEVAFDTAVPSNLNEDDLKAWFQVRIEAQTKLLLALEDAGIFLAEDGATIPKLMARRRQQRNQAQQDQPQSQQTGQQFQEGQTATNQQGQRIIFTNGQWVVNNG